MKLIAKHIYRLRMMVRYEDSERLFPKEVQILFRQFGPQALSKDQVEFYFRTIYQGRF